MDSADDAARESGTTDAETATVLGRPAWMLTAARFALPTMFLVFVVVFSALRPDTFARLGTLQTILSTQSVLAVLALSALVPLLIGEFDLSVAANLGLAAILVPGLTSIQGLPLAAAIVAAIITSSVVGFVNGLLITRARLNSFIATIGMSAVISAIVLWYSGGTTIFQGVPESLRTIAQGSLLGVPLPGVYLAVVAIGLWYVVDHTPFGRYMEAVGGSKSAARLSGLDVDRITLISLTAAGALAGIAGVIQAAQLGTGNPAVGPPLLLPAFAAAFLGSTTLKLGTFNVWGTVIAVLTIATGLTGLDFIGVPQFASPLFNGTALLIAVAATRYLQPDAANH